VSVWELGLRVRLPRPRGFVHRFRAFARGPNAAASWVSSNNLVSILGARSLCPCATESMAFAIRHWASLGVETWTPGWE
jgi:hypothetical protein